MSAEVWHVEDEDRELWGPSVDVCAWCGDSECDGIGCIAGLDPDDEDDHPAIEQLHAWIRRGRFFEQVERVLDQCENRPVRPKHGHRALALGRKMIHCAGDWWLCTQCSYSMMHPRIAPAPTCPECSKATPSDSEAR